MNKYRNIGILVTAILMIANVHIFSQDIDTIKAVSDQKEKIILSNKMPEFPGGTDKLRNYIKNNLIYPKELKSKNIGGSVLLRFEVLKTGEIGKIEIQKGINSILDLEAEKVIRSLPNFEPAIYNGEPVVVWYSIAVTFK